MSVQFDEDNFARKTYANYSTPSGDIDNSTGMARWLINNGLAKDSMSANIILIMGALIVFFLAIYFFKYGAALPGAQEVPVPIGPVPILE